VDQKDKKGARERELGVWRARR